MGAPEIALLDLILNSNSIWAALALVLGALFFRKLHIDGTKRESRLIEQEKQYRQDASKREEKLMIHLERSNESQERTAKALEGINKNLASLEGRVDRIEKHTYLKGEK